MTGLPWCAYFEPAPPGDGLPDGAVVQDPHDAAPGPLFFFVPVADGAAVRVPVCEEHCRVLRIQFDAAARRKARRQLAAADRRARDKASKAAGTEGGT